MNLLKFTGNFQVLPVLWRLLRHCFPTGEDADVVGVTDGKAAGDAVGV